jgi:hypothetical protein
MPMIVDKLVVDEDFGFRVPGLWLRGSGFGFGGRADYPMPMMVESLTYGGTKP